MIGWEGGVADDHTTKGRYCATIFHPTKPDRCIYFLWTSSFIDLCLVEIMNNKYPCTCNKAMLDWEGGVFSDDMKK